MIVRHKNSRITWTWRKPKPSVNQRNVAIRTYASSVSTWPQCSWKRRWHESLFPLSTCQRTIEHFKLSLIIRKCNRCLHRTWKFSPSNHFVANIWMTSQLWKFLVLSELLLALSFESSIAYPMIFHCSVVHNLTQQSLMHVEIALITEYCSEYRELNAEQLSKWNFAGQLSKQTRKRANWVRDSLSARASKSLFVHVCLVVRIRRSVYFCGCKRISLFAVSIACRRVLLRMRSERETLDSREQRAYSGDSPYWWCLVGKSSRSFGMQIASSLNLID